MSTIIVCIHIDQWEENQKEKEIGNERERDREGMKEYELQCNVQ